MHYLLIHQNYEAYGHVNTSKIWKQLINELQTKQFLDGEA